MQCPHRNTRAACTLVQLAQHRRCFHVYTHGEGFLGCLGHGDFSDRDRSQPVMELASMNIRKVSAGWSHSAAVSEDGHLVVWGRPYDFRGSLRLSNVNRFLPVFVSAVNAFSNTREVFPKPVIVPIKSRDAGALGHESLRLSTTTKERLRDIGNHVKSQHTGSSSYPCSRVMDVACSAGLTAVVTDRGRVYCMGQNKWGQCGRGPGGPNHVFEPMLVKGKELHLEEVTSLAVGFQHILVLCRSGAVYGWGKGERGQLGIGNDTEQSATKGELVSRDYSWFILVVLTSANGSCYRHAQDAVWLS